MLQQASVYYSVNKVLTIWAASKPLESTIVEAFHVFLNFAIDRKNSSDREFIKT